tara:strand:+ start:10543 stop:11697 length:1155 start_codon:yes stop_codon:yes gene_type:complete
MIETSIALFIGLLCGIFIQRYLGNQKLFKIDNSVRELESDKRLLQKEIELMKENNKDKTQFKEDMLKEISSSVNDSTQKSQKPYFDELTKKEQRIATEQQKVNSEKERLISKEQEILKMHSDANIKRSYSNISRGANAEKIMEDIIISSGFVEGKNVQFRKKQDGITGEPDATLIFPKEKKVLCDAKAPLSKYDEIIDAGQAGDYEKVERLESEFGKKVLDHVDLLSAKNYQKAKNSMDFVLMFLPSESHENLARKCVQLHQKDLDNYAQSKKIIIVGPNTFYPYINQINELWKQHENIKAADETLQIVKGAFRSVRILAEHINDVRKKITSASDSAEDLEKSYNKTFKAAAKKVQDTEYSDENLDKVVKKDENVITIKKKDKN